MQKRLTEKRRNPRIDTSEERNWEIRIQRAKGKPLAGKILNLSVGGVAFESEWKNIWKTIKKNSSWVEIHLPNGKYIEAYSTLLRVRPKIASDRCICVLRLSDMTTLDSSHLERYFS